MDLIRNFIGGKLCDPIGEEWLPCMEPATGQPYARVADSDARDVEAAVAAARSAFPAWSAFSGETRARFLSDIARGIEARLERFVEAESRDSGKTLASARGLDIPRAARNFEFFAQAGSQFSSESHATQPGLLNFTLRDPLGVVGCISPWNLPLYLFSWKIAPALAAGNTVVGKPSEITPMTAFLLAEVCREVGLPAGVLNIVQGSGPKVGAAIVAHPEIRAISFTGSTRVGEQIAQTAAPRFKKLSLELGGKNANLVFADCDFNQAVEGAVKSAFSNQGQICLCGSRILVEQSIYDRFRDALVARVKELRIGDPKDSASDQGALVSREHFEKVLACIETARQEGGRVLTGGKPAKVEGRCAQGWFIEPTLIEGLKQSCRTNQEEIFGPVATLAPFETDEEALECANSTRYGLSATVWTRDLARAHRVAAGLKCGIVWVNTWLARDLRTPFGGMKDSGVGREGGMEAMRFFTEAKNVCIQY